MRPLSLKIPFLCLLVLLFAARARALDWPSEGGNLVLCLLNARDGFWVGTSKNGLWHREARGPWKRFGSDDGLGDDTVRCLMERGDQIWAGTARGGLSIWDGARWKNIGLDEGLPGARVNDLALDEASGDVWVATENGLCRWNDDGGWSVTDSQWARRQIVGVACARGNIWAATACDGLLVSKDRGQSWTQIKGAPIQPNTATGAGLPSDVLNDVAVDELGQIWVATDLGLAKSRDEGANWFWVRGADWRENVEGSAEKLKPTGEDARVEPPGEDWVQTLAPDGEGHIWLGFRQQGAEIRDIQTDELLFATRFNPGRMAAPADEWVRAIVPLAGGRAILGEYGGGLQSVLKAELPALVAAPDANARLGMPDVFPTLDAQRIASVGLNPEAQKGALWNMDVRTRGDWVGRYGDRLAGIYESPWLRLFQRDEEAKTNIRLGWNARGPGPYTYIASLSGQDPDVLYNPAIGTRRMAEINDGTWQAELYPFSFDGPNLWCQVEVGEGAHRVSIYFYNNDGMGQGWQRYRDHLLQLKPWSEEIRDAEAAPDLARCRVSDYWNGTYASFAVSGPGKYWIKIGRHRSNVTKLSGIFVDRIGEATPAESQPRLALMQGESYQTQPTPDATGTESATVAAARAAWERLDQNAARGALASDDWTQRHQLLRAASAAGADQALLSNWRWKLALWNTADRAEFDATMARIEAKRAQATAEATTPEN